MLKRLVLLVFTATLCGYELFADQADLVFTALKAKNGKEVTRLLQNLALARDYAQLDKVRAKNPELFDVQYFPGEFISKILFNYVENAAALAKAASKATGKTNPHPKNSASWYVWDLDKALDARAATKDTALQKTLTTQINTDLDVLQKKLENEYMDENERLTVSMYLYALLLGAKSGSGVDAATAEAERLNAKFAEEANSILGYLFKAGVPFPATLPTALKFDAWKRLVAAYNLFLEITKPILKSEYETEAEFVARQEEAKRLHGLIYQTEITLPAQLTLGEYNIEGGYFKLNISLPALEPKDEWGNSKILLQVAALAEADIRYYIHRKNAPFFKEKGFTAWTATATIIVREHGGYGLKELVVRNGTETVTEGLWGFRVWVAMGSNAESVIKIEKYIRANEFDCAGTRVSGFDASIPVLADGNFILSSSAGGPGSLWVGNLTAAWEPVIGGYGPAGGIIFYDKGDDSDGWRYLEAAPFDQSAGIRWDNGKDVDMGAKATAVGGGEANTDAIVAKQGDGTYAASICQNLVLGGYDDWFLPSWDELNLMYTNLKKAGLGGFGGSWFWSSSQYSSSTAWSRSFSDGRQADVYESDDVSVRACRAF